MFNSEQFKNYRKKLLSELKNTAIKNSPQEVIDDLIKIRYFLQDKECVLPRLYALEKNLRATLAQKKINYQNFISSTDTKNYKILSDTLKDWLKTTFFSQDVSKVRDFLDRNTFFTQLKDKRILKDIGAGPLHGEWSHFIQWYLICSDAFLRKNLYFEPETLYSILGCKHFNNMLNEYANTLWDISVDVKYGDLLFNVDFDFSCPEFINFFLARHESLPILAKSIEQRTKKRNEEFSKIEDVSDSEDDMDSNTSYDESLMESSVSVWSSGA